MKPPRRPRAVVSAVVPLPVLHVDVPPTVPYARRTEVEARLTAGGFRLFTFTLADVADMVRGDGWSAWLRERGHDPSTAEPVFFEWEPGMGDRPALLLGALLFPPKGGAR